MDAKKEILDAIDILIDRKLESVARIYTATITQVNTNSTVNIRMNGDTWTIKYYGNTPSKGKSIPVFVPNDNMSLAFIISPGT